MLAQAPRDRAARGDLTQNAEKLLRPIHRSARRTALRLIPGQRRPKPFAAPAGCTGGSHRRPEPQAAGNIKGCWSSTTQQKAPDHLPGTGRLLPATSAPRSITEPARPGRWLAFLHNARPWRLPADDMGLAKRRKYQMLASLQRTFNRAENMKRTGAAGDPHLPCSQTGKA